MSDDSDRRQNKASEYIFKLIEGWASFKDEQNINSVPNENITAFWDKWVVVFSWTLQEKFLQVNENYFWNTIQTKIWYKI